MKIKRVVFALLFLLTIQLGIQATNVKADTNNAIQTIATSEISENEYLANIQDTVPITSAEYLSLIKNQDKNSFIIYVGYKECPYCRLFSITLDKFIDNTHATVYYLDYDSLLKLSLTDTETILQTFEPLGLLATPSIYAFVNGKPEAVNVGSDTTISELIQLQQTLP